MRRYALPRLGDLVFMMIFAGCLAVGWRMLNTDSDLGRDLTLGNIVLATHKIPTLDVLSFTRLGQSRPPYEWFAQVLFSLANQLLGLNGVVLMTASVIALSFLLVFRDSLERSHSPVLSLLLTAWAAVASSLHWLTRPHVFSFLLFAIWLHELDGARRKDSAALWHFPIIMLIWANTHGAFIFGFLAWLAYLAGWIWELIRHTASRNQGHRLLVIGASSLLSSILTPDLWGNWTAVLANRSPYVLSRTVETMPVQLSQPGAWPMIGLCIVALVGFLVGIRRMLPAHVLLLLGLAASGLSMARNVPFFAIAAAPIVAEWLHPGADRWPSWFRVEQAVAALDAKALAGVWSSLLLVLVGAYMSLHHQQSDSQIFQYDPAHFPVEASTWLMAHPPQGHMFNEFNWGGYLLYRLWPQQRVFIDSQSDFYGESFIRSYEQVMKAEGDWEATLDAYSVTWVIVPSSSRLSMTLATQDSWQTVYADSTARIFTRSAVP